MAGKAQAWLVVAFTCLAALAQPCAAGSARVLAQTGGTCPGIIPACAATRCSIQEVDGKMQSVCERCSATYMPSTNSLNCVCPPGTYENDDKTSCIPCERGYYCAGGNQEMRNGVPTAEQMGWKRACRRGTVSNETATQAAIEAWGLTTKFSRARRHQDCVPIPGFSLALTSPATQSAALCPTSTYSPGFGRIRQCLRCQSGLEEDPADLFINATNPTLLPLVGNPKLRVDRTVVCKVPSGRYLVQNVVRDCKPGTFRNGFAYAGDPAARYCQGCPPGLTGNSSRPSSLDDCNIALPGVRYNGTAAPLLSQSGSDVSADLCPYGTYFEGGPINSTTNMTCKACPFGTQTQNMGAASMGDCMVPPGYYINLNTSAIAKCPNNVTYNGTQAGFYRETWTVWSDSSVQEAGDGSTACKPCGPGILSATTDIDERGAGNDTTQLVAASPFSCYIAAGWGVVPSGRIMSDQSMEFIGSPCPNNTYGVATTTNGLASSPCKPCARNTFSPPLSTNYSACVNPAGFGVGPDGASACPPGYYAAAGSLVPCLKCPPGRTTDFNSTRQTSINDCYVMPGMGVYDGNSTNPWNPSSVNATTTVLPCPVGYFSTGLSTTSVCTPCPTSGSTYSQGATSLAECTVCQPGYGYVSSLPCTACAAGTYQAGYAASGGNGDGFTCTACANTSYIFLSSRGAEPVLSTPGTTWRTTARGREECVPRFAQVGIDVGARLMNESFMTSAPSDAANATACINGCGAGTCCFVSFDYGYFNSNTTRCLRLELPPATSDTTFPLVYYKMLPSDVIAASSLRGEEAKAKSMSSGLYARCSATVAQIGAFTTLSGATGSTSLRQCRRSCDEMSTCWGFTVQSSGNACVLRGGTDALDLRTFFRLPTNTTGLNW
ncbi:hypothetical protein HT031_003193 [Scenedesmus sp. PABB004]|nr:hypothetical protein HT031_003193 [Scenedesmus sp. PABB004]